MNVYQAVRTDRFGLTYEQFWEGFRRVLAEIPLRHTTEPVLRAALGLPDGGNTGCGRRTVRVTPKGTVIPCVYWPDAGEPLDRLLEVGPGILDAPAFVACRRVPSACEACQGGSGCRGGCGGWRALAGRWALFAQALHHHHTGEDTGLWPLLEARTNFVLAVPMALLLVLVAMKGLHLSPRGVGLAVVTLAGAVAAICGLGLFSSEIALSREGVFMVVDYANDPIDLRHQSSLASGVPDEIVQFIAERLAAVAAARRS